jgi:hypothetical protein
LHLLNDGGPVVFGHPRADTQLVSDELGRQPLQEKGKDLSLALDKMEGPRFHRQDGRRHVAIPRYHDDRRMARCGDDLLEQINPAYAGKLVVEEHTGRLREGMQVRYSSAEP